MDFPFGTNGKFIILGVPILKHIRVPHTNILCLQQLSSLKSLCQLPEHFKQMNFPDYKATFFEVFWKQVYFQLPKTDNKQGVCILQNLNRPCKS